MYRALIITREDPFTVTGTETEVRFIEQSAEELRAVIPPGIHTVFAVATEQDGKNMLKVGFMADYGFPDSISLLWETIPTDGLLRVTLHDVALAYDEGSGAYFPESIGDPVKTLYAALSPGKIEEQNRDALLREAEEEAAKTTE